MAHVGPDGEPVPPVGGHESLSGRAHRSCRRVDVRSARAGGSRGGPRRGLRRTRHFVSGDCIAGRAHPPVREQGCFGIRRIRGRAPRRRRPLPSDVSDGPAFTQARRKWGRADAFEEAILRRLMEEGLAPELVRREETRLLVRFGTGAKRVLLEAPVAPYATAWKATA